MRGLCGKFGLGQIREFIDESCNREAKRLFERYKWVIAYGKEGICKQK